MTTATQTIDLARYNGYVTAHNPATGQHRTFRIQTVHQSENLFMLGKRIIGLLVGPDNTSSYQGFGFVEEDGSVRVWSKHRGTQYEKLADVLNRADYFAEQHGVRFECSVKCRKCNRDLTDPLSIELGIGPVCRENL